MSDSESTNSDLDINAPSTSSSTIFTQLYICPHCPEKIVGSRNFETHIREQHISIPFNPEDVSVKLICKNDFKAQNVPKKKTKAVPIKTDNMPRKANNVPKKAKNIPKQKAMQTRVSSRKISQASSSTHNLVTSDVSSQASPLRPDGKEYVCKYCEAKLNGVKAYRAHQKSVHYIQPGRKISQASSSTHEQTSSDDFSQTSESRTVVREYVCSYCPAKLYGIKAYRDHGKKMHDIQPEIINMNYKPVNEAEFLNKDMSNSLVLQKSHVCPNCPKKFFKVGSFRRHLRSHLNIKAYVCPLCIISEYCAKEELLSHLKVNHQKNTKCKKCGEMFCSDVACMVHFNDKHLYGPPFKCQICEAIFPTYIRLLTHQKYHTRLCPHCQKRFFNKYVLYDHILTDHKDEELKCPDSEPKYKPKRKNKRKNDNDSFDELETETDANSFTSEESETTDKIFPRQKKKTKKRPFIVCFICERRFRDIKHLEFHMEYHPIFPCKCCQMFFADEASLLAHESTHPPKRSKKINERQTSLPQLNEMHSNGTFGALINNDSASKLSFACNSSAERFEACDSFSGGSVAHDFSDEAYVARVCDGGSVAIDTVKGTSGTVEGTCKYLIPDVEALDSLINNDSASKLSFACNSSAERSEACDSFSGGSVAHDFSDEAYVAGVCDGGSVAIDTVKVTSATVEGTSDTVEGTSDSSEGTCKYLIPDVEVLDSDFMFAVNLLNRCVTWRGKAKNSSPIYK